MYILELWKRTESNTIESNIIECDIDEKNVENISCHHILK